MAPSDIDDGKPWKWFFAYNGSTSFVFDTHIELMVRSAAANTSLDGHLIFYGARDHPILPLVKAHGVDVIHHEPSILADLQRIKAKFPDYPAHVASGAFLRIDLPTICRDLGYEDAFVLYTDCDAVFQHDLPSALEHDYLRPALFACAPQRVQDDWDDINSGVMVMNVEALQRDYPAFKEFITSGDTLYEELWKAGPFDQQAYQLHYQSRWDRLPLEYNWKPYWGFNEDAFIVHFHGPKIGQVRNVLEGRDNRMSPASKLLYEGAPDAYSRYLEEFQRYIGSSGDDG